MIFYLSLSHSLRLLSSPYCFLVSYAHTHTCTTAHIKELFREMGVPHFHGISYSGAIWGKQGNLHTPGASWRRMTSFSLSLVYVHTNSPTNYSNIPYIYCTAELTMLPRFQACGLKTKMHSWNYRTAFKPRIHLEQHNTTTDRLRSVWLRCHDYANEYL